jgi:P-type Cu+ transporter
VKNQNSHCYHCGESLLQTIEAEGQFFCCGGCAQVYGFLKNQQLEAYYDLDVKAGRIPEEQDAREWELLKDAQFVNRYVVYQNPTRQKLTWSLPNIHCGACVWLLEKLPQIQEGVLECRVDLMRKKVELVLDTQEHTAYHASQTLLKMGYAPDLRSLPGNEEDHRQHHREEWLKIGVAGFCFGNVMLFSFPEYFAGEELGQAYENVFRTLNFLLSCPVIFYCARGILLSGVKSLGFRALGVDLPISLGIVALFFWSTWEVVSDLGSGYFDSLCGLVFFLLMGRSFQRQSFQNLVFERDEHRFFPLVVTQEKAGVEKNIPLSELRSGDTYRLGHGGMIPMDSLLIKGQASLDYRLVSGESELQKFEENSTVYAGGLQRGGQITLRAIKEVQESSLARMWASSSSEDSPQLESLLDQIGRIFTVLVLALAFITFMMWKDSGVGRAIELACSVLIIACPCALALSAPLTLGAALRHLAKAGCYVKSAQVIEKCARLDTLVFDKTGTLTCVDECSGAWLGSSSEPQREMARACAQNSTHPVAVSLAKSGGYSSLFCEEFQEISGFGMLAKVAGHEIKIGRGDWASQDLKENSFGPEHGNLSRKTILVIDGVWVDVFVEQLRWREGVEKTLPVLGQKFDIHLVSGDNDKDHSRCAPYFKPQQIHFQQSPLDKKAYIQKLASEKKRVAMIGDGINDAQAMKVAWVGIAVPVGSGRFAPSSEVIVAEAHFHRLESFLSYSRSAIKIVVICVIVSLGYNIIGLTAAMEGWISPLISAILMPLSSLTVMTISIFLTGLVAKNKLNPKTS